MEKGGRHIFFITVLNVVSALAVVGLHTNCFWSFSRERWWITANILECVFYFAVPIFMMLTGATLLDYPKKYDTKTFYIRRVKKTLIPFFFWSITALLFRVFVLKNIPVKEINAIYVIDGILNTKFCGIYWFFIPLFAIYLSIPLFAYVQEEKGLQLFKQLAVICFLINILIPFVLKVFQVPIKFPIVVLVGSGHLLYLLLGYLLCNLRLSAKEKQCIYVCGFLGLLLHIGGTHYLSMEAGRIIQTYKGYQNVPGILYSVSIFLFIKEHCRLFESSFVRKIIEKLSDYSFSIYLLHWFVLSILYKVLEINKHSILWRLGGIIVVSFCCICLTWVIRKIPVFGKKVLP